MDKKHSNKYFLTDTLEDPPISQIKENLLFTTWKRRKEMRGPGMPRP
jgi:hypothetical protein